MNDFVNRILLEAGVSNTLDINAGISQNLIDKAKKEYFKYWDLNPKRLLSHGTNIKNLNSIKKNGLNKSSNFFSWGEIDEDEASDLQWNIQVSIKALDFKNKLYPDPEGISSSEYLKFIKKGRLKKNEWGISSWLDSSLNPDLLFYFYMLDGGMSWVVINEIIPPSKIISITKINNNK